MKKFALSLLAAAFVLGLSLNTAHAIAPFKKEFDEKYVKNSTDQAFVAAAKKANCLICHGKNAEGKEDKKVRNAYGKALAKLLNKKDDAKNVEKIQAARHRGQGKVEPRRSEVAHLWRAVGGRKAAECRIGRPRQWLSIIRSNTAPPSARCFFALVYFQDLAPRGVVI